ncbi:MAG: sporulation protein [Lysinibacillus sp.]
MSIFNKALASIGLGAAKVDTKLEKSSYVAGETVRGIVEIKGGNVEQDIATIYLTVYTTYIREANDKKYTDSAAINKVQVCSPFSIKANEGKSIPFSFELSLDTPVTMGKTKVWIQTGVDIKNAVDPTDKDFIEVKPTNIATRVLNEMTNLGFRLRKVDCEKASLKIRSHFPFVQEFEFAPTSGTYRSHLDELEIVFLSQAQNSAELLIQIDRKVRGLGSLFAEALDMDESYVRMTITAQDLPHLNTKLSQAIAKHL